MSATMNAPIADPVAVAAPEKHWLVKRAEEMPLGGIYDPAEARVTNQFLGALSSAVKPIMPESAEETLAHVRALIAAEEAAQQVIAMRRQAAKEVAA